MAKTIGRVTLFNARKEEGKANQPDLRGYLETPKGKFTISLWAEPNPKVEGGVFYKGQLVDTQQD